MGCFRSAQAPPCLLAWSKMSFDNKKKSDYSVGTNRQLQQKSSKVISSQEVGAKGKELASVDDDEYEDDFSEPPSARVTKGKA